MLGECELETCVVADKVSSVEGKSKPCTPSRKIELSDTGGSIPTLDEHAIGSASVIEHFAVCAETALMSVEQTIMNIVSGVATNTYMVCFKSCGEECQIILVFVKR